MNTPRFIVTFRVDGGTLSSLLGAIAPECELVSVAVDEKKHHHRTKKHMTVRIPLPANAQRHRAVDGAKQVRDVILAELDKGYALKLKAVEDALEAAGYSRKSASPRLSYLQRDGLIKRNSDGTWIRR